MSQYWKADETLSKEIKALAKQERKASAAMRKLAKSIGASTKVVSTRYGWSKLMSGFIFATPPKSGFYRCKQRTDSGEEFWIPRAGTATRKAMDALRTSFIGDVCKLIGFTNILAIPGICERDGFIVIHLPSNAKFKHSGLSRISDVEFENMRKGSK